MTTPCRLNKKEPETGEVEAWILNHAYIFLPVCFVILMILFVFLIYVLVGGSATESGLIYNHLKDVI